MNKSWSTCRLVSWAIGILAGLLVFYWSEQSDVTFLVSLMAGIAAGSFIGLILDYKFCNAAKAGHHAADHSADHSGHASHGHEPTKAQTGAMAAPEAAAAPVAVSAPAEAPSPAAQSEEAKPSAPAASVKSNTLLAGESELEARKGDWTYEAEATTEAAPAAGAAKTMAEAPEAAAGMSEDFDGDGALEGKNEGTRPAALTAARDGKADDLKKIKGVGPKMEKMCNALGFYHFDQIASWSAGEVAWVDANLEGFNGRVTRDQWVEQAKLLATGDETEFSKRVDKGGVY